MGSPTVQEFRLPSDPGQYSSTKIIASQSLGASMDYQLPEHQQALAYNPARSYVQYNAIMGDGDSPHIICCFLLSRMALSASSKDSAAE